MSFYRLVQDAMEKSPEFQQKMEYWVHKRKRVPQSGWLLLRLIEVLGYDTVEAGLKAEVEQQKTEKTEQIKE